MKFKSLIFVAFALGAISSCTPDYMIDDITEIPRPITELKVMSFNVKVDNTNDNTTVNGWGLRKEASVTMINEYAPTLIGLQEANFTNQWSYLKETLKDKYEGFGVNRDTGRHDGTGEVMGILYDKSKVELLRGGTFWLSETPNVPSLGWGASYTRCATWGVFRHKLSGQEFCYINTHLDHKSASAQQNGMKLIKERFAQYCPKNCPMILTADFNVTADHDALQVIGDIMKNTCVSTPVGCTDDLATYNGWKTTDGSIIDHIYVSRSVDVCDYSTIQKKYGDCDFISDHYPIISTIKF